MIQFESEGLVIRSHGVGTILRTRPDGHGRSFSIPDLIARTGRVPHVELTGFDETATHSEAAGLLENAYTPVPVCSPARASFLTGLLPTQHGLHDYLNKAPEFHGRDWLAGFPTLPGVLKAQGYRTGLSGKWHLGRDDSVHPDFDDWFSLAGEYPIHHMAANRYCDNGEIRSEAGYKTHLITERTVQFLRGQPDDQPFFHFTGFYATHSPWSDQPERLVAPYRDCTFDDIPGAERAFDGDVRNIELPDNTPEARHEAQAQYYAAVSAIDEGIGRILDELEARGQLDNTIVVYTSDHGLSVGHHGIWGKGNATRPQNLIEESIRIPMIVHAPGRVRGGLRLSECADHLDLFATLLDFAGAPLPATCDYPGQSLRPLLSGGEADWRDAQFAEYGTARMIRTDRYKYIARFDNRPDQLFDLDSPKGEGRDVIGDPAMAETARTLAARLAAHFARYENSPPDAAQFHGAPKFNPAEAWR